MENLMHVPSGRQNLKTTILMSHTCLIYRELIMLEFSWMMRAWSGVVSYQPWEVLPEA